MMRTQISAALYIAFVHYAYISYINPTFEYAHYIYIQPEVASLVLTYLLSWSVVLAYRDTCHPAQFIGSLIYTLCYVPIQLSLLFTIQREYIVLFPVQFALAVSMALIFRAARSGPLQAVDGSYRFARTDRLLAMLTISALTLIVIFNREHMRLVSFEDVYDLRSDSTSGTTNPFLNYLASWVSYCFLSYFFARGIIYRKWMHLILGLIGSLILYMTTGAKSSLLLLPMTVGVILLWQKGPGFLSRLQISLIVLILVLIFLLPDDGVSLWVKSIILVRIIGTSGWAASKYFEYFDAHLFTYYTHIGPINAIFGGYPYGDYSLGQLIGIEYSGSPEANFNASFWASDGLAAMGLSGIYLVTIPLILILYLTNRLTLTYNNRFTVAWFVGFVVAMLNVPIATAMLSGGGFILFLLAWFASRKRRANPMSLSTQLALNRHQSK